MTIDDRGPHEPFFSVCVPQYDRTDHLLALVGSLAEQSFRDFEVCISDGRSPEGRHDDVVRALRGAGLPFAYQVQDEPAPYDPNLRAAIALARGRWCLLMGNDDALAGPDALRTLHDRLRDLGPAGVAIPDFEDFATGRKAQRIRVTRNWGAGPRVAAGHFRNFSFVSGVVLRRDAAQQLATPRWDGSEMYQTYLGCRMVASGLPLLELADSLVRKDVLLPGRTVDSYATRPRAVGWPIAEHRLPLASLGRLVIDAVTPYVAPGDRKAIAARVLLQLLGITYPFWILEYRRVQSWGYAAGVCLGMRPAVTAADVTLGVPRRLLVGAVYAGVTVAGLTMPLGLFARARNLLYRLAKAVR